MFCKKCGEVIQEDSVFCPKCGTKQKATLTEGRDNAGNVPIDILKHGAEAVVEEILQDSAQQLGQALHKKSKKATHKILVRTGLTKENVFDKIEKFQNKLKKRKWR